MKRNLAVLVFALVFPSVMTWLYFVQLVGDGRSQNSAVQVAMALGKLVQFGFPLAYVWCVEGIHIGLPRFSGKGFRAALGFGVLTALGLFGLYFGGLRDLILASAAPAAAWQKLVELNCTTPLRYLLLAVFIVVFHSLLEEYYWRWFVFGRLRRHVPLWPAILVSSLGFMAHHIIVLGVYFPEHFWTLAMPFSLAVAIGGGVWAWLYNYSHSLVGIWLSHLIVDAAILAVGYDLVARYFGYSLFGE